MRLFKGKNTYNQHVSVSGDTDKNCTIITAHEYNDDDDDGDNEINANSNGRTNNCNISGTDIEANRSNKQKNNTRNDGHHEEKKEVDGGGGEQREQHIDKNGEYDLDCKLISMRN